MGLFSNDNQHLGIDIGANGIKLVQLKKAKGRPQLWTYGMSSGIMDVHETVPEATAQQDPHGVNQFIAERNNPQGGKQHRPEVRSVEQKEERIAHYGDELKALLKEAKVTAKKATASLPVSQVFHAAITLPVVEKKELDHHVRAKVKKLLPLPIEEMQVVHQLIEPEDPAEAKRRKYMQVLVTAAPTELISFYTNVFQHAGLELDELETEAFALERSLVGHEKGTVMIIDVGGSQTNFFIIDKGLPITHRSIQIGGDSFDRFLATALDLPLEAVHQMKGDLSHIPTNSLDTRLFHHLLDPITKEISYHIDLFSRQTGNEGKKVEKIILTGGVALFPPIISGIRQQFALNVFVGDPWARVVYQQGLKGVLDELGPRMAVSIGLAMRNIL